MSAPGNLDLALQLLVRNEISRMMACLVNKPAILTQIKAIVSQPLTNEIFRCQVVQVLVDAGANVNFVDNSDRTPLHYALSSGSTALIKALIKAGADANVEDSDGNTLMFTALDEGDCYTPMTLIKCGASPNQQNEYGSTPLHFATQYCNYQFVKFLLNAGADVTVLDHQGKSAIDYLLATDNESVDSNMIGTMFDILKNAGVPCNGGNALISVIVPPHAVRTVAPENTPFWLAANNDAPMLAAELAGGLDPTMRTKNGMSLLHWACAGDAPECVQVLLAAKARATPYGYEPIFYSMHESGECLRLLIEAGDDVNQHYGMESPIDVAVQKNMQTCISLLIKAGVETGEDMSDDGEYFMF